MRWTVSQINFDKELYMFRTDLLSIIRSLSTVYTAIGICHTSYVDFLLARSDSDLASRHRNDSSTTTAGHTPFVNTRCCKYSLIEFLMMGDCFTRNM
jgi:hypothetical protein